MNDLIRRQDAINVIDDMFMEDERYKVWLKLDINNLPSAPMDAIPIEWIFDWENRYMNALPPEFQGETVIELFMEDWRKEQEKQNEQTD